MPNILRAIVNIAENTTVQLRASNIVSENRINSVGGQLEDYIKDAFCEILGVEMTPAERLLKYGDVFCYLGNQNNPPDSMLRNGDAIEVKKLNNHTSDIALNSSYPKSKLHSDDSRIVDACRTCEDWKERDIIYVVGVVEDQRIKSIWMVYGDCYAADRQTYERIDSYLQKVTSVFPELPFGRKTEPERVRDIDPKGITKVWLQGRWFIQNPMEVFGAHLDYPQKDNRLTVIMRTAKYQSFDPSDLARMENAPNVTVQTKKMPEPNNPENDFDATLIEFIPGEPWNLFEIADESITDQDDSFEW